MEMKREDAKTASLRLNSNILDVKKKSMNQKEDKYSETCIRNYGSEF